MKRMRCAQLVLIPVLLLTFLGLAFVSARAEGSRNLTDNGGFRPYLQYSGNGTTTAGILRDNVIKVYVNEGETLYLGSSAIGIGVGDILWTAPDGATGQCSDQGAGVGRILNRAQEVAGAAPLAAGGYTPCTLTVGAGQAGIWLVTFTAPLVGGSLPTPIEADAEWTQQNDVAAVAAWDITVVGTDSAEKRGRVYASYLPMTARLDRPVFSEIYVLTRDGYQYRWNLNGLEPTTFILFSNKKGFKLAATDEPSYESVALEGGENNNLLPAQYELNAPDDPDIGTDVTYKLFFNIPSPDLPLTATRPTTVTWLLRPPTPPIDVNNLTFTPAAPGPGGTFAFDSNSEGRYQLFVDTNNDGSFGFENDVVFSGDAVAGANSVVWDGLDPDGNPVDINVCYQVLARGIAGEIHFPVYDAEKNLNGMIIERINGTNAGDFTVYYNDVPIGGAQALLGESSQNGAHSWGIVPGGDPAGFGNQRGIDTWAYAIGDNTDSTEACEQANLVATKRDSLLTDADGNGLASPGDTLQYEIIIQNSGAAAANNVVLNDTPDVNTALVVGSVTTDQGTVTSGNGAGDTNVRIEIGTIPGNGSVTVRFDVTINSPLPSGVTQVENQGFISSTDLPITPTDDPDTPEPEDPTVTPVVTAPILDAFKRDVLAIDQDGDGNVSPGDRLEYELTIANTGNTEATNVVLDDTPGLYTSLVVGSVQTSQGTIELGNNSGDSAVRVNIGSIPAGTSVTIVFRVDIDNPLPPSITQVENQGIVSSSELPTVPSDDPDTPAVDDPTITPVRAAPLIDVFKADSLLIDADGDGFASPGDTLVYDITVLNNGNTSATDVIFTDTPDANTTLVSGSVRSDQGTITSGNNAGDLSVGITIGEIPSGGVVNLSFRVTINNPLPVSVTQVENQGIVSGGNFPNTPSDDPDTPVVDDPTVTPVVAAPILVATKRDSLLVDVNGDGVAGPGDTLTYQIVLLNNGNQQAENVIFTDTPDANTALVAGEVQTDQGTVTQGNNGGDTAITIEIGTVPPGAIVNISFQVTIDDPLPAGVTEVANQGIFNTPTVTVPVPTDDPDTPEPNDPTVTPVGESRLAIVKSSAPPSGTIVRPGDSITYRVSVTNTGIVTVSGVVISDTIPVGTTYVPDSATPAPTSAADPLVWTIPTLGVGQSVTVSFAVQVNSEPGVTTIRNIAVVDSNQTPPTPSNETEHPVRQPTSLDPTEEPSNGNLQQVYLPLIN